MITISWPEDVPHWAPDDVTLAVALAMNTVAVAHTKAPLGAMPGVLVRIARAERHGPIGTGLVSIDRGDGDDTEVLAFLDEVTPDNYSGGRHATDPQAHEHIGFFVYAEAHAYTDDGPTGQVRRVLSGALASGWRLHMVVERGDVPVMSVAPPDEADDPVFDHPLARAIARVNNRFRT